MYCSSSIIIFVLSENSAYTNKVPHNTYAVYNRGAYWCSRISYINSKVTGGVPPSKHEPRSAKPRGKDMTARHTFYGKQLSATSFERLMEVFRTGSRNAVELAGVATYLRLDELGHGERRKDTCIVDLGSGPGVFLGSVLRHAGLAREVPSSTCMDDVLTGSVSHEPVMSVWSVDPFLQDSVAAAGKNVTTLPAAVDGRRMEIVGGRAHFMQAAAVEFVEDCRARGQVVDRILMKEVIHHIREYDALFEGLRDILRPETGVALIYGRTPSDAIPWFPQAARLFDDSCMDVERLHASIASVPGLRVETFNRSFEVRLDLAQWCTLLRGRFWSSLATIGDEEMEQGIAEVREMHGNDDAAPIIFPDRFSFFQLFCENEAEKS